MFVLLDVETSGFPDFNKRARDPSQPHIVQAAILVCDELGNIISEYNQVAKPDGWEIPKEAADVHGFTTEKAMAIGIPEREIAAHIKSVLKGAKLLIAHNITFDKYIARIALRRFDLMEDSEDEAWKAMPTYCTMRTMTNICMLPGKRAGQFKYPKLSEAYKHAFGKELSGAHDALNDIKATKELFFWLKQNGH